MTELQIDDVWGDASIGVSFVELSRVCGMSTSDLDELVEYGALQPLDASQPERLFSSDCIASLRIASRLRRDFELDIFAISFLLDYLNRIGALEEQVRLLQAHVSPQTLTETLNGE